MTNSIAIRLVTTAVIAVAGALPADASEWRVELDSARTRISFTLKATLHTVQGTAQLSTGVLEIDTETGAVSGDIVVDAASANTGNTSRDKKMHRKVLQSADHPSIVLRPHRIEGFAAENEAAEVVIVGEIELLGTAHEISIPLSFRIDGAVVSATARFTVPYVEWGLEDPSTFILRVAKEVNVTVEAEGTITALEDDPQ